MTNEPTTEPAGNDWREYSDVSTFPSFDNVDSRTVPMDRDTTFSKDAVTDEEIGDE